MTDDSSRFELSVAFARELSRRRVLAAMGVVAALGLTSLPASAQTATPSAEQERVDQLTALSKSLCGGGTFDSDQATVLLHLLSGDAKLKDGLEELLAAPVATATAASATPTAARSDQGQATAEAILLFWYTGVFNGDPIQDRSAAYTNLLAWQAMYTPSWTTCKLYGAWANAPTLTPQVPENA
jgi:hypothetical protein